MTSPYIVDIRWRIASEEKAKRMPPAQPPFRGWYARRLDDKWGYRAAHPRRQWAGQVHCDDAG